MTTIAAVLVVALVCQSAGMLVFAFRLMGHTRAQTSQVLLNAAKIAESDREERRSLRLALLARNAREFVQVEKADRPPPRDGRTFTEEEFRQKLRELQDDMEGEDSPLVLEGL